MSVNAPRWIYGKPELVQSTGTTVTVRWIYGKPVVVHEYVAAAADILPSGIAGAEAHGSPGLSVVASPSGIASAEALGSPGLAAVASPFGIDSAESIGSPDLQAAAAPAGISSSESLGTPELAPQLAASGIASAEAFGEPTVTEGTAIELTDVGGIASAESLGAPLVAPVAARAQASGLLQRPPSWPFRAFDRQHTITGAAASAQAPQTTSAVASVNVVTRGLAATAQALQRTRAGAALVFGASAASTQAFRPGTGAGEITTPADVFLDVVRMIEAAREAA